MNVSDYSIPFAQAGHKWPMGGITSISFHGKRWPHYLSLNANLLRFAFWNAFTYLKFPAQRILTPQKWLFWGPGPLLYRFKPFHWRVQGFLGWWNFLLLQWMEFPSLIQPSARIPARQHTPRCHGLGRVDADETAATGIAKVHLGLWEPGAQMTYIWSRFAVRYPPPRPTWYGPKTCVLQHSAWKRCICSVFCMVGCWCGPQPCKFVWFLQPTFRKRVICNVSASTSWSSAAAPSSISVSNYHIILNLLLTVFSLGTGLISVYILCLSNFLLECLVFRNWSNLKFS